MRTVRRFLPAFVIVLAYLIGHSTDVHEEMTQDARAQSPQDPPTTPLPLSRFQFSVLGSQ